MGFDYETATKGMIQAIDNYSQVMTQRSQIENQLLMQEIKRKRSEEDWQKKQDYLSPMERAYARKYYKQNPEEIEGAVGISGVGMEAKSAKKEIKAEGTGGQATTSQGTGVPSTYTPPAPQDKTIKQTATGFAPMSPKEQITQEIMTKYREGTATDKELKYLGLEIEKGKKLTAERQVYADIMNKGIVDKKGELSKFRNREDAELYTASKLGHDWKTKHPQVIQMLDSRYGPSIDDFKKAIKQNNIKSKRHAVEYLTTVVGMDREKAIDWINENN